MAGNPAAASTFASRRRRILKAIPTHFTNAAFTSHLPWPRGTRANIMSPSYVTIDASPDLDCTLPLKSGSKRSLLLAPPSVAAHEEKLRGLFTTFGRSTTDLQMLDRLSAGLVTLAPSTYGLVLVLTDDDGARRAEALKLLTREVYTKLVPSMTTGARLQFQDGPLGVSEAREAILAGLVQKDGSFEKPEAEDT